MANRNASRRRKAPDPEGLVLVQAWVPASVVPKIDELARGDRRTRSGYLREVIIDHVQGHTAPAKEPSR